MDAKQWKRLQSLRQAYLKAQGDLPDYWQDEALVEAYDATLGMRIRWKWRAILETVSTAEWPTTVVDWACGAGGASREWLDAFPGTVTDLALIDRSRHAMNYAAAAVRKEWGDKAPRISHEWPKGPYILLISHVLSELPEAELKKLWPRVTDAAVILWVEAGRTYESRRLSQLRETLLGSHAMLAPCPHQAACGMLAPDQQSNWCHFMVEPPGEVHQSAFWRDCAKQLGFDLRSLPVSYLLAQKGATQAKDQDVRILAGSRAYKGYVRWNGCLKSGVVQKDFSKRHSKSLYRRLEEPGLDLVLSTEDLHISEEKA